MPFKPTISALPQGDSVDSPEATEVDVGIPFDPTEAIANSYLKTAKVVLPEGTGLNPASANGLRGLHGRTVRQGHGRSDRLPGRVEDRHRRGADPVAARRLADRHRLRGAAEEQRPSTGEQFRIFIYAGSDRYAVNVRLEGKVFPDLTTGQLTAVVDDNPQATFSSFKLRINGGPKGTLTSPPICGPHTTNTVMTPWSGQADAEPTAPSR